MERFRNSLWSIDNIEMKAFSDRVKRWEMKCTMEVAELLQNTICLSPVYSIGIQVQANHVLEQWEFNM